MNNTQTHAITTPNKKPATPLDNFRVALEKDYRKYITNFFDGKEDEAMKFMSAVVYSVQKNPQLLECDPTSLMNSFMCCAEFQLYPSNVAGEAFIIPYKKGSKGLHAQFQLGYQGLITLFWRAGVSVHVEIVRKNDKFEYNEGLNPDIQHSFPAFSSIVTRGEPVGIYAVATTREGHKLYKVMSIEEILKFKEFSQAKNSEYSPWNSASDPELWMPKKTCIKQLGKLLPKTEVLQKALAEDNQESTIATNRANLDAAGPAVGGTFHKPADISYEEEPDPQDELNKKLKEEAEQGKK